MKELKEIFYDADEDESGSLSRDEFEQHLNDERVKAYLQTLDLDVADARGLYRLLDLDGMGEVGIEDFVSGCLRLKGPAKSIDVCTLIFENRRLAGKWVSFAHMVANQLESLADGMGVPMASLPPVNHLPSSVQSSVNPVDFFPGTSVRPSHAGSRRPSTNSLRPDSRCPSSTSLTPPDLQQMSHPRNTSQARRISTGAASMTGGSRRPSTISAMSANAIHANPLRSSRLLVQDGPQQLVESRRGSRSPMAFATAATDLLSASFGPWFGGESSRTPSRAVSPAPAGSPGEERTISIKAPSRW